MAEQSESGGSFRLEFWVIPSLDACLRRIKAHPKSSGKIWNITYDGLQLENVDEAIQVIHVLILLCVTV